MSYKFENLKVWHRAIAFSDIIYAVSEDFPKHELYGLVAQIRRATNSIALNISEGATGKSDPEYRRFLTMAARSCAEVVSCLHLGRRRGWIDDRAFKNAYDESEVLYRMINNLKNSITE